MNVSAVAGWLVRNGAGAAIVRHLSEGPAFPLVPVDVDLAVRAALLEPLTRPAGLGIGDRLCLAPAAREGVPALTADAAWTRIAAAAGVEVVSIR